MRTEYQPIAVHPWEGYTHFPKPSTVEVDGFESQHKLKLPKSYREFVLEFGPGELGGFRLAAPGSSHDDVADLGLLNKRIHEGERVLIDQYQHESLVHRMFFFASSYAGDLIGWDPHEVTDANEHVYAIFCLTRVERTVVRLANSFVELVRSIIRKALPVPLRNVQPRTSAERKEFRPFAVPPK
jgi:hypothetical protein